MNYYLVREEDEERTRAATRTNHGEPSTTVDPSETA
jgi:hypothetical protein